MCGAQRLGDAHPTTVQVIVNMAGTLQLAGRYDRGRSRSTGRAWRTQRKVYGNEHPLVATTVGNLALVEHELHNERRGRAPVSRGASPFERKTVRRKPSRRARSRRPALPRRCRGRSSYAEAERLFRQAIDIERTSLGEQHPAVGVDTSNLAECLMDMKRYAEAEPLLLKAERLLIASSGETHPRVGKTRRRLARLYRALNRPDLVAKCRTPVRPDSPRVPRHRSRMMEWPCEPSHLHSSRGSRCSCCPRSSVRHGAGPTAARYRDRNSRRDNKRKRRLDDDVQSDGRARGHQRNGERRCRCVHQKRRARRRPCRTAARSADSLPCGGSRRANGHHFAGAPERRSALPRGVRLTFRHTSQITILVVRARSAPSARRAPF